MENNVSNVVIQSGHNDVIDAPPSDIQSKVHQDRLLSVEQLGSSDDLGCDVPPNVTNTDPTDPSSSSPMFVAKNEYSVENVDTDANPSRISSVELPSVASSVQLPMVLRHHVFKNGNWKLHVAKPHPTIKLSIFTRKLDYDEFNLRYPVIKIHSINAITDSGAHCCLWGWADCQRAGLQRGDLIPVRQRLNGVSKSKINIYGAVLLRMFGISSTGECINCAAMVYVSPDVTGFYLSEEAMMQLKIISSSFPNVGSAVAVTAAKPCDCQPRTQTPGRPKVLPMKACVENIPLMEKWLRDYFATSTFNLCPHVPIPSITGPPLRIHANPTAEPKQAYTPAKVSLHWEQEVEAGLKEDEAQHVIEKVPYGETSEWCHRMVVTRKSDGKPRRTVDLSPLNKHCVREVHPMKSPFESAKGIPPNTWRTVTDARNGFHSIPLHPDDKHVTTCIMQWGRYRYLKAPQGYASSCDGYNRRMDEITADFERLKRCVDDNCHFVISIRMRIWSYIGGVQLTFLN